MTDLRMILAEHLYRADELAAEAGVNQSITDTAAYLLDALAAPEHRDALVAWLEGIGLPALADGEQSRVVADALEWIIEDYPEQEADKRHEATSAPDGPALLAEARALEQDVATARTVLARLRGVGS